MSLALGKLLKNTSRIVYKVLNPSFRTDGKLIMDSQRGLSAQAQQQKIDVLNLTLNYEMVGSGPHPVLCLPGALGCIESDFTPQLQKLNREKFTIVAWDPPGYGKSRPPDRDVRNPAQTLSNDAIVAHQLMLKLGFEKYSLLGWSDGGTTSLFLASAFPGVVSKMIIWGSTAFVSKTDRDISLKYSNIDTLSDRMKKSMIDIYGEEYFRKLWEAWMLGFVDLYTKGGGDSGNICRERLPAIICPTLVIHGAKDPVVGLEHAKYIHAYVKNSKLLVMPEGKHNLHLRFADEFNLLTEKFLLQTDPKS